MRRSRGDGGSSYGVNRQWGDVWDTIRMVLNIRCSIRRKLLSGGELDCEKVEHGCNDPELHRCGDKIEHIHISARGDSYNSCQSAAGLDR